MLLACGYLWSRGPGGVCPKWESVKFKWWESEADNCVRSTWWCSMKVSTNHPDSDLTMAVRSNGGLICGTADELIESDVVVCVASAPHCQHLMWTYVGLLLATVFEWVGVQTSWRGWRRVQRGCVLPCPLLLCSDKHSSETVWGRKDSGFHFQVAVHNEEKAGRAWSRSCKWILPPDLLLGSLC